MKKTTFLLLSIVLLFACDKENIDTPIDGFNKFDIVGSLEMTSGPHDMAVKDNYLFGCIDDKIKIIDISDVNNPIEKAVFDDLEAGNDFEALYVSGNTLYAGCTQVSGLYALDITNPESASVSLKNIDEVYSGNYLRVFDIFADGSVVWASGSNGSNGMLVKYNASDLSVLDHYTLSGTGNAGEGVWANTTHVFMSTINGHVYAFDKTDIASGFTGDYTFTAEPGHEHWGRSVTGKNNQLFWADWGAGFITVNISDPNNLSADDLITHSSYTGEFSDAEGTNVYDVLIHEKNGMIYLANGWSGLVEIDPSNAGHVESFIDYKDNQYYCIEQYQDYVIVSDIVEGTTDFKGIKIILVNE